MGRRLFILVGLVAVSCGVCRADDEAAALAGVRALLAEMSEAVEAGDVGEYLSHISPHDVTFLTEQRNWAADLREHPVSDFAIRLLDPRSLEYSPEHGWAAGEVLVSWRMQAGEPLREIQFPARFVTMGGAGGVWFYAGERWNVVADDRHAAPVRAMAPDGLESIALQIVEVLPGVREQVDELFGIDNDREVQVKVYASMEHLQASVYLSYTDPLGGWNEPGESIKLLAGPSLRARELRRLLAHEYGHVATFVLGERVDGAPWWALEGVAELASVEVAGGAGVRAKMVREWKAEGKLKDWDRLDDFRGEAAMYGQWVYVQGWSMLRFITDRFGGRARNEWVAMLAGGEPLERATRLTLGVGFGELDAMWRESIDAVEDAAQGEDVELPVDAAAQPQD